MFYKVYIVIIFIWFFWCIKKIIKFYKMIIQINVYVRTTQILVFIFSNKLFGNIVGGGHTFREGLTPNLKNTHAPNPAYFGAIIAFCFLQILYMK